MSTTSEPAPGSEPTSDESATSPIAAVVPPPPPAAPVEPPPPPPPTAPASPDSRLARMAGEVRKRYGRLARRSSPVLVVAVPAVLAAIVATRMGTLMKSGCGAAAAGLLARLEVTVRAGHFASLLPPAGACRDAVVAGFRPVGWDGAFSILYALALSALYVWVERWRCHAPDGTPRAAPEPALEPVSHFMVLAPLAAGLLDATLENGLLWRAASLLGDGAPAGAVAVHVFVGSAAAALKWVLLLVFAWGLVAEVLRGPRGEVLRRTRFSVLTVLLGAAPLLLIPQGQDVLQRLVEGAQPVVRTIFAVLAVGFAALTAWYCARQLVKLPLHPGERGLDDPWYQFFAEQIPRILGVAVLAVSGAAFARAGLALGRYVIVGAAGMLASLLVRRWLARHLRAIPGTDGKPRLRDHPRFRAEVVSAVVAAVVGVLVVVPHWLPWEPRGGFDVAERAIRALRLGAWLMLVAARGLYLYVYFRRVPKGTEEESWRPREQGESIRGLRRGIGSALLASALFLALFTVEPVEAGRALGPLWVLALTAANATFFGSLAVWVHRRYHVPVVRLALVAAVLFSIWNENHLVRTIPAAAGDGTAPPPVQRVQLGAHFREWLAALPPDQGRETPVILVAAAGGGLRAGYWTAAALAALQDRDSTFARHVFAISSVSGGSLGAAGFAALVHDADRGIGALPCADTTGARRDAWPAPGGYSRCVRRLMRDDYLSPVLAKLVAPDLTQRFLPIPFASFDRSRAMEESWEDSYEDATGRTTFRDGLLELARDPVRRAREPALLMNAAHVESGRRYVASTLLTDTVLHDTPDVLQVLGREVRDIPLSAAVHNSARFPGVSPAGYLVTPSAHGRGRLVDGGYFEASGLTTIQEVYAFLERRARDTTGLGGRRLRFVVLYLCNDPVSCNHNAPAADTADVPGTIANELLSPPRAVLSARDARGEMSLAQLRDDAAAGRLRFLQLDVCDSLSRAVMKRAGADTSAIAQNEDVRARARARVVSPPLGWLLSKLAQDWMDGSLAGVAGAGNGCQERNARVMAEVRGMLAPLTPRIASTL